MASQTNETKQIPKNISYFKNAIALYTVDFPIFFIESISERHIVIAGGGGSSKTGVQNQINVLELVPTEGSCSANLVMKYQTPEEIPDAIMTGALMRDMPVHETRLVCGGTHATVYNFDFDVNRKTFNIISYESLKDLKPRAEIKTVRYSPGCILTGGIDGQLTCWNISRDNNKLADKEIKAHSKEIDEIDIDVKNQHIVTLSRGEGRFIIWNLRTFKQLEEISSKSINNTAPNDAASVNYIFRSCRYAYDTTSQAAKASDSCLLVACNPMPGKNNPSKILKWQITKDQDYELTSNNYRSVTDSIMAMTVSLDGKYVAIGTRSGGVVVLEVKNMQNIYTIDGAHHNLVTSLEFLPPKQESLTLTNSHSCPLLSVSIDRRVVLHRPRTQSLPTRLLITISLVLLLYLFLIILNNYYDVTSYIRLD